MTAPKDPEAELHSIRALADAIRLRAQTELDWLARSQTVSPLLRACLNRARGHLELAQRALSETRPERAFASGRGLADPTLATLGPDGNVKPALLLNGPLRLDPTPGPADAAPRPDGSPAVGNGSTEEGGAQGWAQCRVEEIGRALESALGDGLFDETVQKKGGEPESGAAGPIPEAPPHFSGHTDVLSIPDLVGFFQAQSKTGVLEIEHASEAFRLEFEHGALLHAASSKSPAGERLGEILVRHGALTEARLAEFLSQLSRGERLGSALLRLEGVSQVDLTSAIEEQVLGIFVRLAKLPGCRFTFRETKLEPNLSGRLRHNVTRLLLDSARFLDDEAHALRESA